MNWSRIENNFEIIGTGTSITEPLFKYFISSDHCRENQSYFTYLLSLVNYF